MGHGIAGQPVEVDPCWDLLAGSALEWDLHQDEASPLADAGHPKLLDPDGDLNDAGAYGGSYPGLGLDCDDMDDAVHPGAGC